MSEKTSSQNTVENRGGYSWAVSETTRILDHQLQEIRDQRNQALRVLRVQFAVAGILVAALTAVLSTSTPTALPIKIVGQGLSGEISGPLAVIFGIFLLGRGIIGFFRASYSALNVLSIKPVSSIPYSKQVKRIVFFIIGKETKSGQRRKPMIGPEMSDLEETVTHRGPDGLVEEHLDCIGENKSIIENNEENLFQLYRKMAWGLTTFGLGIAILILALPSFS